MHTGMYTWSEAQSEQRLHVFTGSVLLLFIWSSVPLCSIAVVYSVFVVCVLHSPFSQDRPATVQLSHVVMLMVSTVHISPMHTLCMSASHLFTRVTLTTRFTFSSLPHLFMLSPFHPFEGFPFSHVPSRDCVVVIVVPRSLSASKLVLQGLFQISVWCLVTPQSLSVCFAALR